MLPRKGRMRLALVAPCLFAPCLLTTGCFVPSVAIAPRYVFTEVDGSVAANAGGSSGSSSLEDLGLDDSSSAFSPRVDLDWLGFQVSASTLATSSSGRGTLDADLDLGGDTISAGDDVDSDLDLDVLSAAATFDIIPTDFIDVGVGLGVTMLEFDARFRSTTTNDLLVTDESLPIPVLAARVGSQIGPLDVGAVLGFIDYDVDDVDASLFDLDIHAAYRLLGEGDRFVGHIVAGYRYIDMDGSYEDGDSTVATDFTIEGPYVGVAVSF